VIEHLRSNRQRTDPQKIEIQQRRNVLARRIKVWRVAQAVYMPQASAYLPDESGSPTSDDTQGPDNTKPETWLLFLPSAIPGDDRSPCYKGVIETEKVLRLAQLQDNLVDLRRFRRALRNLRLYFKTNLAGEGQKTQTKSRTIETGVNSRIKRAILRYRTAYRGLLDLDPTGDWTNEYRELRDEDNRGPLKEAEEMGTGDGRYTPSWIWATSSAAALPEGSIAEQQEINETARHEWMTCRARADRWMEEEELLQEEMRRVIIYLEWKSRTWSGKVGVRAGSCTLDIQHGVDAYARKQANIHHEIAISFARQWLPYLDAYGYETKWAAEFPWASQILSAKTKLPERFTTIPANAPYTPPATDSSPPGTTKELGTAQEHTDTHETRSEGDGYKDERGERTNDHDEGSDDKEQDFDDEDEGSDDEGEGSDDGAETSDEFGFEYDDQYMS
jgi:hypothetical protein